MDSEKLQPCPHPNTRCEHCGAEVGQMCLARDALITAARRPDHFVDADDMVGRPADMSEWLPIGPEQRDGTPILAGSVNHECREIVEWQDDGEDGNEGWVNTGRIKDRFYANPRWFTHYVPLPAAPGRPSDSNLQNLQSAPDQPTPQEPDHG